MLVINLKKIISFLNWMLRQLMKNIKFNFEKYSRDLSEIEKDSQKILIDTNGFKVCWRSWVREHL